MLSEKRRAELREAERADLEAGRNGRAQCSQQDVWNLLNDVDALRVEVELRNEESAAANRLLTDLRTHLLRAEAEVELLRTQQKIDVYRINYLEKKLFG